MNEYKATGQRAGTTDVAVSIGLLTMRFDLVPQGRTKKSEDVALRMVCPEDHPGGAVHRVSQRYVCDGDPSHGPFAPADVKKARETDDGLVIVDKDKVAEAKAGGLDKGALELKVHPADQVTGACRPGGKGYRLRPAKTKSKVIGKDVEMYGVLRDLLVARPDVALVGELVVKDARSLYRLEVWGEQLMLSELVHPEDLAERDSIVVESDPVTVGKMGELVGTFLEDWDPALHRFDAKAAVDQVAAEAAGEAPLASVTSIAPTVDINSFLDQALAARKAGAA